MKCYHCGAACQIYEVDYKFVGFSVLEKKKIKETWICQNAHKIIMQDTVRDVTLRMSRNKRIHQKIYSKVNSAFTAYCELYV